jgi:hypothetical protein
MTHTEALSRNLAVYEYISRLTISVEREPGTHFKKTTRVGEKEWRGVRRDAIT